MLANVEVVRQRFFVSTVTANASQLLSNNIEGCDSSALANLNVKLASLFTDSGLDQTINIICLSVVYLCVRHFKTN